MMNYALYILSVLVWGTTWIAIAIQSHYATPAVAVFWRMSVAFLVLWGALAATGKLKKIDAQDHLFCVLQGATVFSLNFICFYSAVDVVNSGQESVIFSTAIFFNALNAWIFFRQKPAPRFFPAAAFGIIGIVTLFWRDLHSADFDQAHLLGILQCLLGTYLFSLGNMISARHQRKGLDVLGTSCYAMGYGALLTFVIVMLTGEDLFPAMRAGFLAPVLYLAIFGSVIAFTAYFALIGRIGPANAAYATLLFPLVALTLSTFIEGFHWTGNTIAGVICILAGNAVLFTRPGWRPRRRRPT